MEYGIFLSHETRLEIFYLNIFIAVKCVFVYVGVCVFANAVLVHRLVCDVWVCRCFIFVVARVCVSMHVCGEMGENRGISLYNSLYPGLMCKNPIPLVSFRRRAFIYV